MPSVWHSGSYEELLRALVRLRAENAVLYWHLRERYLRSWRATRDVVMRGSDWVGLADHERVVAYVIPEGEEKRRKRPSADANKSEVVYRAVLERWNPRVRAELVKEALGRIVGTPARPGLFEGSPRLPLCNGCDLTIVDCVCRLGRDSRARAA